MTQENNTLYFFLPTQGQNLLTTTPKQSNLCKWQIDGKDKDES